MVRTTPPTAAHPNTEHPTSPRAWTDQSSATMPSYTSAQQKTLSVLPHITGVLSLLGSCSILYDIWTDRKHKLKRPYFRILLGMSLFDAVTSFSTSLSTWPIPRGTEGVYGALGTTGTCTAQGFFNQLSLTSSFYNLVLAAYYVMLGTYQMTDEKIAKYEPFMHAFAILPSMGFAIAGLPLTLYNNANLWCWIAAYPPTCEDNSGRHGDVPCERGHESWLYRWLFFYAPLWTAIASVTLLMTMLTLSVKKEEKQMIVLQQEYRERRASFTEGENGGQNSLPSPPEKAHLARTKKMFYQALFYVGAFYLTWISGTIARLVQLINGKSYFALMCLHSFLTPLQGFFNFIVYRHGPCVA